MVADRTKGTGCPQCSGRKVCQHSSVATRAPTVAAQWDYKANDFGTPDTVVSMSNRAAAWVCHSCGHHWTATISGRVQKQTKCPNCGPRSKPAKHTKHPSFAESQHQLLAQWDHKRNVAQGNFPHNTTAGSGKDIHWLCPNCPVGQEHSWTAKPASRTSKHPTGCPFCRGRLACKCNSLEALTQLQNGTTTGTQEDPATILQALLSLSGGAMHRDEGGSSQFLHALSAQTRLLPEPDLLSTGQPDKAPHVLTDGSKLQVCPAVTLL